MKNTTPTRPAPQRATRTPQQAHRLMPKKPADAERLGTPPLPHDFFALCFYPGMGRQSTAA